jgi:outer membrane protein, heavy metal efflux system
MRRHSRRLYVSLLCAAGCLAQNPNPPRAFTWQETQQIFRANNPTLLAGQLTIDEAKADEVTAFLRPNPDLTISSDGTQITPEHGIWRPLSGTLVSPSFSYLHERNHKRELRLESAQKATQMSISTQSDLERNLLFNLRDAFVRVLQAKANVSVAKENLGYYDKVLDINRARFQAGAISHVDFQRLELQRIQFESDLATAQVNLRTAKIDLLAFLKQRTPVDEFDVSGLFEFSEPSNRLEQLREMALASRPDLKEAAQAVAKAKSDHQLAIADGSTDPTFTGWWTHNGSFNNPDASNTIGASVSVPLRIFDRNQGEKAKTLIDITRTQRLRDAAQVAALHDVDSAYATLQNTLLLLRPYKQTYLKEAEQVRETVSFAYQHGAASLIDFLDAQKSYRDTQLSYLNLVGAYLSAANQVNFSIGREVIQ